MSGRIVDQPAYRNRAGLFADRFQAGEELAGLLQPDMAGIETGLVLAIPAGGVPVGLQLSRGIGLPLDVFIVRKVQVPGNPEAGFGAVTLDGEVLLNERLLAGLRLSPEEIQAGVDRVKEELAERNRLFRGGGPGPEVSGRTVILADDGLASGFTMLVACRAIRKQGAAAVVVAVPTAPLESARRAAESADAVYCLHIQDRGQSFAVASAYRSWRDLSGREAAELLGMGPGSRDQGGRR